MVAMGSENPLWESAKQLQVATSRRRRKFFWRRRTMFWVSKTEIRVRRHANQKISINTRLLLKIKLAQIVFPSATHLNSHLGKKNFFFIKSQNRQKLSKNDGKTFQRSLRRYIFINWSNYVHMMLKKRSTDKISLAVQKINPCFGRVVEGSFLSKAEPKRRCFSYSIKISVILLKSDFSFLIYVILRLSYHAYLTSWNEAVS